MYVSSTIFKTPSSIDELNTKTAITLSDHITKAWNETFQTKPLHTISLNNHKDNLNDFQKIVSNIDQNDTFKYDLRQTQYQTDRESLWLNAFILILGLLIIGTIFTAVEIMDFYFKKQYFARQDFEMV